MSLFRRDIVRIGVEPDCACLVKLAGPASTHVLATASVALDCDAPAADAFAPLAEALAQPRWKTAGACIVLADALVRYFVVARPQGVRHRGELEELVAARFEEQFGLPAADWVVSGDLVPGADNYLACAAPRWMVAALRGLCADLGVRLAALQPFAVSEMNRWRRKLPPGAAWFGAADTRTLTLAYRTALGWQGVRTHDAGDDPLQALAALAERDALVHGVTRPAEIVFTGVGGQANGPAAGAAGSVRSLGAGLWPGHGESWARTYRVALSGVWP